MLQKIENYHHAMAQLEEAVAVYSRDRAIPFTATA